MSLGDEDGALERKASGTIPGSDPEVGLIAGVIPTLAGRRILIAEDVATNQFLLEAVLAPTGAEIELVADGAALLERFALAPADLVLMDLLMPCLLYTSPSPRDRQRSRMPSSA